MVIEQRKKYIYSLLQDVAEEKILFFIEDFLQHLLAQPKVLLYAKAIKPKINLEDLKVKQNYQTQRIQKLAGVWADEAEDLDTLLEEL